MTASPRSVLGEVRIGHLKPWWEPTQVGKPITPRQAFFLRRRMWSSTPNSVMKALAERGLITDAITTGTNRLTPAGEHLREALGDVPAAYWPSRRTDRHYYQRAASLDEITCRSCGREVNAELFPWSLYDGAPDAREPACLRCLTKEAS